MAEQVGADLADTILALEAALAKRDFASLPGGIDGVLDDDFVEIGSSGRAWTREETISTMLDAPESDVAIEDFQVDEVDPGVVLAQFVSILDGRRVARSSTWLLRDGRWRLRFHRGTVAAEHERA